MQISPPPPRPWGAHFLWVNFNIQQVDFYRNFFPLLFPLKGILYTSIEIFVFFFCSPAMTRILQMLSIYLTFFLSSFRLANGLLCGRGLLFWGSLGLSCIDRGARPLLGSHARPGMPRGLRMRRVLPLGVGGCLHLMTPWHPRNNDIQPPTVNKKLKSAKKL